MLMDRPAVPVIRRAQKPLVFLLREVEQPLAVFLPEFPHAVLLQKGKRCFTDVHGSFPSPSPEIFLNTALACLSSTSDFVTAIPHFSSPKTTSVSPALI